MKNIANQNLTVIVFLALLLSGVFAFGKTPALASTTDGTIDATYRFAWGENIGWIDFGTVNGNVHVTDAGLSGYAFNENNGWINLNAIANDGEGHLSGMAWSENTGFINFSPANGGVTVSASGVFSGSALSETVGWIIFSGTYPAKTDWRPQSARSYTLTYAANANGTISGSTPQTVNYGTAGTAVTAVPNAGYHFTSWSDASTQNPRTDTNVTTDHTYTASFAINTYTLTYTAGANGSLTGTISQTVSHGGSGTAVNAVPNVNYHFVNWSDLSTANPRTDTNVTGNVTVTANFALTALTYTLTYTAGANGSLTGNISQTVNSGADGTAVTAVPAADYHFVNWSDSSTTNPRMDTNVVANITVTANFASNTVVHSGVGGNGPAIVYTPLITIRTPGSGAAYNAGSTVGFDWTAMNGAFTKYKISYSIDNGTNWMIITNSATSTALSWTVPNTSTTQGKIKVEGFDANDSLLASAVSAGNFAILGTAPSTNNQPVTPPPATDATATGAYNPAAALTNTPDINTDKGLSALSANTAVHCTSATLIKASLPTVYYCGADGKRYVFTNDKAFFTWYDNFSSVVTITAAQMAAIPLGGNITYRPGKRLIKIQSDPKVYAISRGGLLRWVSTEAIASQLFGRSWNRQIDDVSDAFFVNYKVGAPISGL